MTERIGVPPPDVDAVLEHGIGDALQISHKGIVPVAIAQRTGGNGIGQKDLTTVGAVRIRVEYDQPPAPSFLFDLDGTLIDSVYQHVIAWRNALAKLDIDLSVWRIHRRIGMSGGLFVSALLRETGRSLSDKDVELLQEDHAAEYLAQVGSVNALPGARELLAALTAHDVPWAIATSGRRVMADKALEMLDLPPDAPVVTREMVAHAKPDPDLFLAAAALIDVDPAQSWVVGDSVWDLLAARRAGALGVGLQSGGYGREELERAGAYRVYADPAQLLARADELGVRGLAAEGGNH
jgi:HAD superfamily hydrolase (TIGR01509 family)